MPLLTARLPSGAFLLAALTLIGCGGDPPAPPASQTASADVRRIGFTRSGPDETEMPFVTSGSIDPSEGIDTWEIVSPEWIFENSGARQRPLRLTGQGKKLVTIPGPFEVETFDRIAVTVENSVAGSMVATVKMTGGEEVQARADVEKGRFRHPVTFKLPRPVLAGAPIDSIVIYLDLNRAVTIYELEFLRRPVLTSLPSPDSGARLVAVGPKALRSVGLGPEQQLKALWSGDKDLNAHLWVAGLPSEGAWSDDDAKLRLKLIQTEPFPGEAGTAPVEREVSLLPGWTPVSFLNLAAGSYTLDVSMEQGDEGTVAVVSELTLAGPPEPEPRTVVLVTSSSHRADHLGATRADSDGPLETPHLDALSARGVLFESAWATSNTAVPSHSALFTARHPRDTKVLSNDSYLADDPESSPQTLAQEFASQGFATVAVIGSSHLADRYTGLGRGFDVVIQPEEGEARAAQSVTSALAQLRGGTPTFLWLHLFDAHGPYDPPAPFDRRYYPEDRDPFDSALPELELDGGQMPLWLRGLRDHDFPRAQYRAEIAYLDEQLGALLENPRVAAGVVAFTADHGEVFARKGVFYRPGGLFPDTLRVPLIVSAGQMVDGGRRVSGAVSQIDLGRTLLDLAELGDVAFPGRDLLAETLETNEPVFAVSRRSASVTDGSWHAVLALRDHGDTPGPELHQLEVYDLSKDPGCLVDLAEEQIEVAARYRKSIVEWLAAEDVRLRAARSRADAIARKRLLALGYAGVGAAPGGPLYDPACSCIECLKFK